MSNNLEKYLQDSVTNQSLIEVFSRLIVGDNTSLTNLLIDSQIFLHHSLHENRAIGFSRHCGHKL